MGDLVLKQAVAVIDQRTTLVCLNVAGQIKRVSEPFDTLNGALEVPPFHVHCRAIVVPYLRGAINDQREQANAELMRRPVKQRDPRKVKSLPPVPKASTKQRKNLTPPKRARRRRGA